MAMPANILDKGTVKIGFIGLGLMGEPADAAFTFSGLGCSRVEP
jgi:hypothetical protein